MRPKSLSASSIKTWNGCPSRFVAENILRGANFQGVAASLGTCLHDALEHFIRGVKILKNVMWDEDVLLEFYRQAYIRIISTDTNTELFREGRAILISWMNRPYTLDDLIKCKVLSLEIKNSFDIPVLIDGVVEKIPFNYIMDRFDQLGEGEYRVIDYKSQRVPWTADELKDNIQAKVYALAAMIMHPDAVRIWVEFDFLRHEKVGIVFSKADCAATWKTLKQIAQNIVDTNQDEAPERLNNECTFCIKKATCEILKSNVDSGGIMSLSIDDVADRFADVYDQIRALGQLKGELESRLMVHASEMEVTDFETKNAKVKISASARREIDPDKLASILGPALVAECEGKMTLASVDTLMKARRLTPSQYSAIKSITTRRLADPTPKVVRKK